MLKLAIGIVIGFLIATVGFSGAARILDNGISRVQEIGKNTINGNLDTQVNEAKKAVKEASK